MSTSRPQSPSDRSSDCSGRDPRTEPSRAAVPRDRYPTPPWLATGVDVGLARVPIDVLAAWAFAVAARDVADWPIGMRHVRGARRFVRDRVRGRTLRRTAIEDLEFTAALLARIFDAEMGLCALDALTILDALGLPTDAVPLVGRRTARVRATRPAPTPPVTPICLPPAGAADDSDRASDLSSCLSIEPRFRNAA